MNQQIEKYVPFVDYDLKEILKIYEIIREFSYIYRKKLFVLEIHVEILLIKLHNVCSLL